MKKQEELINFIEISFSQNILLGIDKIYANQRCKMEFYETLGQKKWKEVAIDDLVYRDDIIISLSDEGFLYYLPAFLLFMIIYYEKIDVMGCSVIGRLTPKLNAMNVPRASWVRNIYDCLTEQQRKCVQEVLLYLWETYDDGLVDEALNNYWFEHPELAEI